MRQLDAPLTYRKVREGREPGEILSPYDRRILITNMVREGLDDWEIAAVTRWTPYTVERLRTELHLPPNPARKAA